MATITLYIVIATDTCGYHSYHLAEDRKDAKRMVQEMRNSNIYRYAFDTMKVLRTKKELALWETYLAEKLS